MRWEKRRPDLHDLLGVSPWCFSWILLPLDNGRLTLNIFILNSNLKECFRTSCVCLYDHLLVTILDSAVIIFLFVPVNSISETHTHTFTFILIFTYLKPVKFICTFSLSLSQTSFLESMEFLSKCETCG